MPPDDRTLSQWLALQESVHPRSIDMGLARVAAVAGRLGLQRVEYPTITIAGTNGKGSTVAHAAALLEACGCSTGMFTSPHFLRYNERIRVRGQEVDDEALLRAFREIEAARGEVTLTFFEYNTLAALWLFREQQVDAAVLEVGLGGRLDATNLIDADVAVIASVGFDHRDWLGDTLEAIGTEKAGIARAGRPLVLGSADMPGSVHATATRLGAPEYIAGRDFRWGSGAGGWEYMGPGGHFTDLPPSALAGSIQYRNAATAIAAVALLQEAAARTGRTRGRALDTAAVTRALRSVRLAGRFQVVPGEVEWILDIAHNEPAAQVLAQLLSERPLPGAGARTVAVVGVLADKDALAIGNALRAQFAHWVVCSLPGPRGSDAAQTAARLGLPAGAATLADSIEAGCAAARRLARPGDRVVVCGSVHAVGPALGVLQIY
ncbi:MAG: bifunctional tetrahydrofolate synthase/dihydrofolate synthase [Proteobacteria bacterium]|nr:bifunctional tetrahydrofolate synthase/dihydrofolate synthase [Pseudomonadota bacterium]